MKSAGPVAAVDGIADTNMACCLALEDWCGARPADSCCPCGQTLS